MIRKYYLTDRPELLEIFKLNTPQYFDPKEAAGFEEYLNENSETYLTIEQDNKIVGGAGYQITHNNSIGRVTWIFFHPGQAGKGLGKEAVEYCLSILKANTNLKKLVVTTSQLAYKFFEKFGFQLISTEKNYWGQGLDLYTMEINLEK